MFLLGYSFGVITSGLLLCLGYYAHRFALRLESVQNRESTGSIVPRIFQRNKQQKKKPKFVSEEQQWAREQKEAPLDPGL